MRSRPDPRPRLAPLRRPPAPARGDAATGADPVPDDPDVGGWVPVVDQAPTDEDLLSEWAPRPGRGRGRRRSADQVPAPDPNRTPEPVGSAGSTAADGAESPAGPPALRLVGAEPVGRPDDDRPDEDWLDAEQVDDRSIQDGSVRDSEAGGDTDATDATTAETDVGGSPPSGVTTTGFDSDSDSTAADDDDPDSDGAARVRVRAHRINGRWGRFAELWVPESMREARVDPGRRGMLVLVLVAAVAAVVAAVGVWRDRPEPRPVETAVIAAASAPPAAAVSEAAASPAAAGAAGTSGVVPSAPVGAAVTEILVSVTGLVGNPGVVRLAPEARVADAIAAAGGTQPGADLTGMNLAAKLADGDSVVVTDTASSAAASGGGPAGGSGGAATRSAGGLVNLNTADEAALDTLPGVGPVMAQNILAWRETNGKFNNIEQLQEISGIGTSRYAQLAPLVTVG